MCKYNICNKQVHYYLDGPKFKFKFVANHNTLRWLRSNASSNTRPMR